MRENYKDGKEDGLFEYFDEEGNLTKTEEYKVRSSSRVDMIIMLNNYTTQKHSVTVE